MRWSGSGLPRPESTRIKSGFEGSSGELYGEETKFYHRLFLKFLLKLHQLKKRSFPPLLGSTKTHFKSEPILHEYLVVEVHTAKAQEDSFLGG